MRSGFQMQRRIERTALAIALSVASVASAQTLPKEGSYDFTSCWSGVSNLIAFSKTQTAFSYEMTGTSRSNPPGGFADKNTFRCVGTNASIDGKNTGMAVCEGVDPAGDKRLTYFSFMADGKVIRETVAGTGKYEGMSTSAATVKGLGPFPVIKAGTFQDCNHQTGTYKLK